MYVATKPAYHFGGEGGVKPINIQDGRVYDVDGNSLDAQFMADETAENLITWLHKKGYACTPEARALVIKEKRRVALERQSEELMRQNQRLMEEETARIEAALSQAQVEMQAQVELHLRKPETERPPLQLTQVEKELLGGRRTELEVPEPPDMADLAPDEMDELQAVSDAPAVRQRRAASASKPKKK